MTKYVLKALPIFEAMQYNGENILEIQYFADKALARVEVNDELQVFIIDCCNIIYPLFRENYIVISDERKLTVETEQDFLDNYMEFE